MAGIQTDVLKLGSNQTKTMRQASGIGAVGGSNPTPLYIHFPLLLGPFEWVFPYTYGFMYPLPPGVTSLVATTRDVPPGYSAAPATSLTAYLVGYDDAQAYSPGQGIASTNIRHIASLALSTLVSGFNQSAAGPFTDAYILGWYWSITGGAASTSAGPAVKGSPSGTAVDLGRLNVGASGQIQLLYPSSFAIRLMDILPAGDTSFSVGIGSDTTVASITRGSVFLGS